MPQPAMSVATSRIVVGPVYHAAFFVPLVFAAELDGIAHLEIGDSGCEVDVVGYQYRLAGGGLKDEFLVAASIVVVREEARDGKRAGDLVIAEALLEGLGEEGVGGVGCRRRSRSRDGGCMVAGHGRSGRWACCWCGAIERSEHANRDESNGGRDE